MDVDMDACMYTVILRALATEHIDVTIREMVKQA